jgi:superoxide dismutase, Cu-Zn family
MARNTIRSWLHRQPLSTALVLAALAVLAAPFGGAEAQQATPSAIADVHDAAGQLVATADLREGQGLVLINLAFPNRALTGDHAIHIFETGRCDPPDFSTAGAIFNPYGKQHGLLNAEGPMAGDLPSLTLGPNGLDHYSISAPLVTLRPGPGSVLRPNGTALVIHARADDDRTQPDGNSGARIACGLIVAGTRAAPATSATASSGSGSPAAQPLAATQPRTPPPSGPDTRIIAALGLGLVVAGYALRRYSRRSG